MKKRYAWRVDVLDISSRMHNFDVFLMPGAYWRFIVNFRGHRAGSSAKWNFNEIIKRADCIDSNIILKNAKKPLGHSYDLNQYYRNKRGIRKTAGSYVKIRIYRTKEHLYYSRLNWRKRRTMAAVALNRFLLSLCLALYPTFFSKVRISR